ncbi:MAG: hypothetical protein CMJ85_09240 [Planctomycetes bacterium]|jgi:Rrf2 family protein|nr:hypothetical protein [Planctomycetota bacterium]MDP6424333.1 Rrf2 family transcriptional regulator [Planctomycetota bacterium]
MFQQMTEIALRGLAYMIDAPSGRVVQSRQIGTRLGISGTYVAKALQPLARIGWLRSVKGRCGGWVLEVDPAAHTVLEAVETLEPHGEWSRCPVGHRSCGDETDCPFHDTWSRAISEFRATLAKTQVAALPRFLPPCYDPAKTDTSGPTRPSVEPGDLSLMRASAWRVAAC